MLGVLDCDFNPTLGLILTQHFLLVSNHNTSFQSYLRSDSDAVLRAGFVQMSAFQSYLRSDSDMLADYAEAGMLKISILP